MEGVQMMSEGSMIPAVSGVVAGTYTGDGAATRTINLGFTPKWVLIVNNLGYMGTPNIKAVYGGLCLPNMPVVANGSASDASKYAVQITAGGFVVGYYNNNGTYNTGVNTNDNGSMYGYLAGK
jgi:hypothetical protein